MTGLTEFAYLVRVANTYCEVVAPHEFQAAVRDMSAEQRAELADAYEAILRRDDEARISEWIHASADGEIPYEEELAAWDVRRLFVLFEHLADAGIPPFFSRRVVYRERFKEPNGDALPQDLRFLGDVTKTFALYVGRADYLQAHANEAELEILGRTAEKIRATGGCERITDLMIDHPEFHIVGLVVALIEEMGFAIS